MCGIFSYSGPRDPVNLLLAGLKDLEYRGYDSAGLAFFDQKGEIRRFRVCGGVEELSQAVKKKKIKAPSLCVGIAHTRWATHGPPSTKNAHPHRFGLAYAVHNGVIENEDEIKNFVRPKKLVSDTDSEWIPCLVHHFRQTENLSFLQSALKTARKLKGAFATALIDGRNTDHLIAFKSGPPLVFGRGLKGGFFVASDPGALAGRAKDIMILEDEELLHIQGGGFQIFDFKGRRKHGKSFEKHFQKSQKSEKGRFPHFMLKEIFEQPKIVRRLIQTHTAKPDKKFLSRSGARVGKPAAGQVTGQKPNGAVGGGGGFSLQLDKGDSKGLGAVLQKAPEILILACGSSYHAGLYAKYILEDYGGIKANVETAGEFVSRRAEVLPGSLALFVSQSGETADILSALKITQQKGLKSLSLCNVSHSSLKRKTDFSLNLMAGPEIAVAATKSFSASLVLLSFLAFYAARLKGALPAPTQRALKRHISALSQKTSAVLKRDVFFLKMMKNLKTFKKFFYLGRGPYYPLALEGALKLKEIAYLHAEAWSGGEMKHGPLAMIDSQSLVVALLPREGLLYKKSLINLKEAKARGACIVSIGGKAGDKSITALSAEHLPLPETHSALQALLAVPPLQMMAYYIARSYGYNVDKPRHLAKSVTVE